MLKYLSSSELNLKLSEASIDKTLYFQDTALFPAFLWLTDDEKSIIPKDVSLTPIFEVLKNAFRLVLPNLVFSQADFSPIDIQLSTVNIAPWVYGFNDAGIISLNGVSYTVFDDNASDLFIISPSSTTLASLNAKYTGSHRVTPLTVLNTLKAIGQLLINVTSSNTGAIPPPPVVVVIPPPTPTPTPTPIPVIVFPATDTGSTMTVDGYTWTLTRLVNEVFDTIRIQRDVGRAENYDALSLSPQKLRLEQALNQKIPGRTHVLSSPRLDFSESVTIFWSVVS